MSNKEFGEVHKSLTWLLELQKSGKPFGDVVTVILAILKELEEVPDQAHLNAARYAVLVAIRVASDVSRRNLKFDQEVILFAKLVCASLEKPFDPKSSCPLKWKTHIQPLLSSLTDVNIGQDVVVFKAVQLLIEFSVIQYKEDLYAPSNLPFAGRVISKLLEVFSDDKFDINIRKKSLVLLRQLLLSEPELSITVVTVVFPGVCSQLALVLLKSGNLNVFLAVQIIQVLCDLITVCLGDDSPIADVDDDIDDNEAVYVVRRDSTWKDSTRLNLKDLLARICSTLCTHRDDELRYILISGILTVFEKCNNASKDVWDSIIYDLALLMSSDKADKVSKSAYSLLATIKRTRKNGFSFYLRDRLHLLSEKLPLLVRNGGEFYPLFRQLGAVINGLQTECLTMMVARDSTIILAIRSLVSCIRICHQRLTVNTSDSSPSAEEFLQQLPLQYGICMASVKFVCAAFAKNGKNEVIDILNELVRGYSSDDFTAAMIVAVFCIESLQDKKSYELLQFAEFCADFLATEKVTEVILREDIITDQGSGTTNHDLCGATAMCALAVSVKNIECGTNKLLNNALFRLLRQCESPSYFVRDCAQSALLDIAKSKRSPLSNFLFENSLYVISRVDQAVRSVDHYQQAPPVLTALLDRVDDYQLFDHVQPIVTNLLYSIDWYSQQWTLVVLRALLACTTAILRWFPEMKPPSVELPSADGKEIDEENIYEDPPKPSVPEPCLLVEQILSRTKHLLSSPHFPVRIIVLKILAKGISFLRFCDDQLLPMIHQNWLSLVQRFDDKELEVRIEAYQVMIIMASVSRTFVYRRIRLEAWPKILKWIQKDSIKNPSFAQASIFRYIETILSSLATLWIDIDATKEDWNIIEPVLIEFETNRAHSKFRKLAAESRRVLEEYLSSCS